MTIISFLKYKFPGKFHMCIRRLSGRGLELCYTSGRDITVQSLKSKGIKITLTLLIVTKTKRIFLFLFRWIEYSNNCGDTT